jgi:hypothetical protein
LWCAVGATSAQAQASDFLQLTLTDKAGNSTTTTSVDPISESTERGTGPEVNQKLDSITVPINEPFIDPMTGLMAHSDDLVISTINGIFHSDPPTREPGLDTGETVTLWRLGITFTSGESDSLKVMDLATGIGQTAPAKPTDEVGSIEELAKPDQGKFGDGGDKVDLNSFTISFTSDPGKEPPPPITDDADGRSYTLTIAAVSNGSSVPEPSTWAMMLLGFAGLGFAGYLRSPKGRAAPATA